MVQMFEFVTAGSDDRNEAMHVSYLQTDQLRQHGGTV